MEVRIEELTGPEAGSHVDALAALRIGVFREFPYLYDGDRAYESAYLRRYLECPRCVILLAFAGDRLVGASTGLPMAEERDFAEPFRARGDDLDVLFYFGESMLLPAFRGRGLGHVFFDRREAFARKLGGFRVTAFCAVERPSDHWARPAGYRSLEGFWRRRGYSRHPELQARFPWKDVGEERETEKVLTFWTRRL
jgi:GNAT superfamily N-acetyltransferase